MVGYEFPLDLIGATTAGMFPKNHKNSQIFNENNFKFILMIEISSNSILQNAPLDFPKRTVFSNIFLGTG